MLEAIHFENSEVPSDVGSNVLSEEKVLLFVGLCFTTDSESLRKIGSPLDLEA